MFKNAQVQYASNIQKYAIVIQNTNQYNILLDKKLFIFRKRELEFSKNPIFVDLL